jgi:hypothetical protein
MLQALHLVPLVLRLGHILLAYAAGPHAHPLATDAESRYSSLAPPVVRQAILGLLDSRVVSFWLQVCDQIARQSCSHTLCQELHCLPSSNMNLCVCFYGINMCVNCLC